MGLIDIHTHLLPGIDDGVTTEEQFLRVIDAYQAAGFTRVVTTPHLYNPSVRTQVAAIRSTYQWAQAAAAERGVQLYLGSEIYVGSNEPAQVLPFMRRFVLLETDYHVKPLHLMSFAEALLKEGYHVILAHVERYHWLKPTSVLATELKEKGVHFQVNLDGIQSGSAKSWLDSRLIDIVASDNHGDPKLPALLAARLEKHGLIRNRMEALFPLDVQQE